MNTMTKDSQADIIRLTEAAVEAAELGQWDAVAHYYDARGALLAVMQQPIREAGDLLRLDEQIRSRVRTAQTTLSSLLSEATATKQRLQGLHQRLAGQAVLPATVSMKA